MPEARASVLYIATFVPQAWVNDNAIRVDPEGETTWDATGFVEAALASDDDRDWAERTIARGRDYDDILRQDPAAPEWVRVYRGPFETEIEARA